MTILTGISVGLSSSLAYLFCKDQKARETAKRLPLILREVIKTNDDIYRLRSGDLGKRAIGNPPRKNLVMIDSTLLGSKKLSENSVLVKTDIAAEMLGLDLANVLVDSIKSGGEDFEIIVIHRTDKKNISDKNRVLPKVIVERMVNTVFFSQANGVFEDKVFVKGTKFLNNFVPAKEPNNNSVHVVSRNGALDDVKRVAYIRDAGEYDNLEEVFTNDGKMFRVFNIPTARKFGFLNSILDLKTLPASNDGCSTVHNSGLESLPFFAEKPIFNSMTGAGEDISHSLLKRVPAGITLESFERIKKQMNVEKDTNSCEIFPTERTLWNRILKLQKTAIQQKFKNSLSSKEAIILSEII